jgi:hypothetical protein
VTSLNGARATVAAITNALEFADGIGANITAPPRAKR